MTRLPSSTSGTSWRRWRRRSSQWTRRKALGGVLFMMFSSRVEFQSRVVCPALAKSDSILRGKQVNSAILNIYWVLIKGMAIINLFWTMHFCQILQSWNWVTALFFTLNFILRKCKFVVIHQQWCHCWASKCDKALVSNRISGVRPSFSFWDKKAII